MWRQILRLALLVAAVAAVFSSPVPAADEDAKYTLPKTFLLGAGTSAYQTEGAWDQDGKGENVFDYYYHQQHRQTSKTGDVAADAYNRYKEDIAIAAKIGLTTLRFSISWARIFPNGTRERGINQKGVDHYHNVIDEMLKHNIQPFVTIFHFDYPQQLVTDFNGWLSESMTDVFADYADFLFEQYGSKVKLWLTVNEAAMYCNLSGDMGWVPPILMRGPANSMRCLHHLLLGHAKAHKIYKEKYFKEQGGKVGFGVGPFFYRPSTNSPEDVAAADRMNMESGIGLSVAPLMTGNYPEEAQSWGRPSFTEDQKQLLANSVDFVGVNIYDGRNASAGGGGGWAPGGGGHGSASTESAWVLREMPKWIANKFGRGLAVFITENGLQETGLDDWNTRAVYSSAFLRELAAGINEDGNNVIGYTMWSFLDAFEFFGYRDRWGLVHVDYDRGTLQRTPRSSWTFFRRVMDTRSVPLVLPGSRAFPDPDTEPSSTAKPSTVQPVTTAKPAPTVQPVTTSKPKPAPTVQPVTTAEPYPTFDPLPPDFPDHSSARSLTCSLLMTLSLAASAFFLK